MQRFIWVWITLLFIFQSNESSTPRLYQQAQQDLYAARYQSAAELYAQILEQDSTYYDAYYGLVLSLIRAHQTKEAYAAVEDALLKNPESPIVQTTAGLAAWRRGDLFAAEEHFRAALRKNPDYPGALKGLASVYTIVSQFKSARDLLARAYRRWPQDPDLMIAHANTLKGADHIAALEKILALLDPDSEEARSLRVHIAYDREIGERETRRLISPYVQSKIGLQKLLNGPRHIIGFGLKVRLNQKKTAQLLLDTGTSGISVTPEIAAKAGLEALGDESSEVKGIGDNPPQESYWYLASEVRIGKVKFADFPISVHRSARSSDYDGMIGTEVFKRFIVVLDFPRFEITLQPRSTDGFSETDEVYDAGTPASGFHRIFRFGNHIAVPTFVNEGKQPLLFLIDSGSNANFMDSETARLYANIRRDEQTIVQDILGKINQVSRADQISLIFAGFRQDNPNLITINLEELSNSVGVAISGLLGFPVLRNLKVAIDYRDGTICFEYKR